jgi:hypothetical protein
LKYAKFFSPDCALRASSYAQFFRPRTLPMILIGPRVAVSVDRTACHASALQRVASSTTTP